MSDLKNFGSQDHADGYHDENTDDEQEQKVPVGSNDAGESDEIIDAIEKTAPGAVFGPVPPNFPQYADRNAFNDGKPQRFPSSRQYPNVSQGYGERYPRPTPHSSPSDLNRSGGVPISEYSGSGKHGNDGFRIGEDAAKSATAKEAYARSEFAAPGRSDAPPGKRYVMADDSGYPNVVYPHSQHLGVPGPVGPKKTYGAGVLISGMVVAALVGGIAAMGTNTFLDKSANGGTSAMVETKRIVNNHDNINNITAVVDKAAPSIVTIGARSGGSSGSGSGIIVDDKGHILTNTHVVTLDGQARNPTLEVRLRNGQVHPARIVGLDPMSDLAVVKVDAQGLAPASFGDSDKLNVGENVVAIGSPLGLDDTATDGIVSNLNRTIQVSSSAVPEDSDSNSGASEEDDRGWNFAPPRGLKPGDDSQSRGSVALNVVQTDASINPGNSGGALLNSAGEVIGVNVAIASAGGMLGSSGSIGVGFSIPSNYAKRIVTELIENGKASHGQLGVSVKEKKSNAESTFNAGAEIIRFADESPAEKAGLKQGDVILEVERRLVSSPTELNAVIREQPGGSEVEVKYLRGKEEKTARVTLSSTE